MTADILGRSITLRDFDVEGDVQVRGVATSFVYARPGPQGRVIRGLLITDVAGADTFVNAWDLKFEVPPDCSRMFLMARHGGFSLENARQYPQWVNSWLVHHHYSLHGKEFADLSIMFPMSSAFLG